VIVAVIVVVVCVVVVCVVIILVEVGTAAVTCGSVLDDPCFAAWQIGSRHPSFLIVAPLPVVTLLVASHNDSVMSCAFLK